MELYSLWCTSCVPTNVELNGKRGESSVSLDCKLLRAEILTTYSAQCNGALISAGPSVTMKSKIHP